MPQHRAVITDSPVGFVFQEEVVTPAPTEATGSEDENNTAALAGISVGVILSLVIVISVALLVIRFRKKGEANLFEFLSDSNAPQGLGLNIDLESEMDKTRYKKDRLHSTRYSKMLGEGVRGVSKRMKVILKPETRNALVEESRGSYDLANESAASFGTFASSQFTNRPVLTVQSVFGSRVEVDSEQKHPGQKNEVEAGLERMSKRKKRRAKPKSAPTSLMSNWSGKMSPSQSNTVSSHYISDVEV